MKKFNIIATLLVGVIALMGTSCATIFTKSTYTVTFTTNPPGANITIENRDGRTIYSGTTPSTVSLKSAAGYMRPEQYAVTLECSGHTPQTIRVFCNLDGWYVGNILLGGLVGMLIVDPVSGAMFKIAEKDIHTELRPADTASRELQILDINQIPKGVELVKIN